MLINSAAYEDGQKVGEPIFDEFHDYLTSVVVPIRFGSAPPALAT